MRRRVLRGYIPDQPSQSQEEEELGSQLRSPEPTRSSKRSLSWKMIIHRVPVKIKFFTAVSIYENLTGNQLFRVTLIFFPVSQCLPEFMEIGTVQLRKMYHNNVTVWFQLAFTLEGLGAWAIVALTALFPPTQYHSEIKGSVVEENHQQMPISMALSHLEIFEENLWLGIHTDLQAQFKNICYNSQAAVISPCFANWLCIASFVIFPLFTTLGLSVFWTNDNMLYWKTNCLKTELENKLFRATEKGFCASDGFN